MWGCVGAGVARAVGICKHARQACKHALWVACAVGICKYMRQAQGWLCECRGAVHIVRLVGIQGASSTVVMHPVVVTV